MGDRGNIVVRQGDDKKDDVWFYTHRSGSKIGNTVKGALSKQWRWTDSSYLARIIFDSLTCGENGTETGFGISNRLQDNEHDIVVVDVPKQAVYTIKECDLEKFRLPNRKKVKHAKKPVSFENYIKV